jgi:ABC-2 type transport system permease protein
VTAVVVVGLGTLIGSDAAGDPSEVSPGSSAWDGGRPTGMFALFGMMAMAVVTSTADHGTGGIVPTLQWTPRRGVLLLARAGVIAATSALLGLVLVTSASVTVWAFLPELGLPVTDGVSTLGEVGLVLACGSLLGVGLGLLTRSTAAALVSAIALVLVLPMLLAQLPYEWSLTVATHLPGSGALYLIFGEGPSDEMTATSARLTLAAWAGAALLAGGWRLLRTDANR